MSLLITENYLWLNESGKENSQRNRRRQVRRIKMREGEWRRITRLEQFGNEMIMIYLRNG